MPKPTLVIMAAGMGSRFGGLKQMTRWTTADTSSWTTPSMTPSAPASERSSASSRRRCPGILRIASGAISAPTCPWPARTSPWTSSRRASPFPPGGPSPGARAGRPVRRRGDRRPLRRHHADDYYGREAMEAIGAFLSQPRPGTEHAMVGYPLSSTLTESGYVSRGVCQVDGDGHLVGITERTHIESGPTVRRTPRTARPTYICRRTPWCP